MIVKSIKIKNVDVAVDGRIIDHNIYIDHCSPLV